MSDEQKNTLNDVTNQLLLKYDENFNKLYTTADVMNQGISNKEELIYKNLESSNQKDKIIDSLQYLISMFLIISVLCIMNALGKLPTKQLIISIIVVVIVFFFIIYRNVINTTIDLTEQSYNTGQSLKSWVEQIFVGTPQGYTCPADCTELSGDDSSSSTDNSSDQIVQSNPTVILNKQSSENVWLYGDKSMNLYNADYVSPDYMNNNPYTLEELSGIEPQPWFRGINANGATYYQCDYKGSYPNSATNVDTGSGIPMIGMNSVFSTIPCGEMNGYTQSGKYICSSDTVLTNLDSSKCIDVTSINVN